ncbi:dp-fucose transporter [Cystoisospora suis]|uniref:Dp-fucose transporter n=1 Tax=Cystoisospora suis TaxID=483139 RepID=A0A2C6KUM1_9APIC|nr:dp-fucose transporter [Cystoisospora suis]
MAPVGDEPARPAPPVQQSRYGYSTQASAKKPILEPHQDCNVTATGAARGARTFLPLSAAPSPHRLPALQLAAARRSPCNRFPTGNASAGGQLRGGTCWRIVRLALSVCTWYASSLILTAANKYLFDTLQLPLPLSVTFLHFSFTSLVLRFCFFAFPGIFPSLPSVPLASFVTLIAPMAVLAAADVALTNFTYHLIPISTITLIKSSLVFFTYLLSIACGLESFRSNVFATMVVIMVSICLTVPETQVKSSLGIFVAFGAVIVGALRWVLVQRTLTRYPEFTIVQLLVLMQPLSSIALSPLVAFYELPQFKSCLVSEFDTSKLLSAAIITFSGIAFAVTVVLAEFHLVGLTSSVSLCVAGVGKEVLTILMSVVVFGEFLSSRALLGIISSIAGILYYCFLRKATQVPLLPRGAAYGDVLWGGSQNGRLLAVAHHRSHLRHF